MSLPDELDMPVTQGREWHMGPTKLSPEERVTVVQYKGQAADRQAAINQILSVAKNGVKNEETGFVLTASPDDVNKSAGRYFSYKERVLRAIAPVFDEVVAKAKLVESSTDFEHRNKQVQGIHIFATPVEIDGDLYRVQLIVRDYITPKQERLATRTIAGIKIFEIENPPVSKTDGGSSDIRARPASAIRLADQPGGTSDRTVSLSELAGGRVPYVRADGKGLFDKVDDSAYGADGVYFERPDAFNQTAWHGSPHQFDKFSTQAIGTGEGAQAHGWGLSVFRAK